MNDNVRAGQDRSRTERQVRLRRAWKPVKGQLKGKSPNSGQEKSHEPLRL